MLKLYLLTYALSIALSMGYIMGNSIWIYHSEQSSVRACYNYHWMHLALA